MKNYYYILAFCTFILFYILRLTYETPVAEAFDNSAFYLLYGNGFISLFHYLGKTTFIFAVSFILLIVIWFQKKGNRLMFFVVLSVGGGYGLYQFLKRVIERPRPDIVNQISTFSFPSGHALHGIVYLFTVAYVVTHLFSSKRASLIVWIAAVILVLLIGLSRIAEARHFASDIIAGWSLGYSWFILCLWWYKQGSLEQRNT